VCDIEMFLSLVYRAFPCPVSLIAGDPELPVLGLWSAESCHRTQSPDHAAWHKCRRWLWPGRILRLENKRLSSLDSQSL